MAELEMRLIHKPKRHSNTTLALTFTHLCHTQAPIQGADIGCVDTDPEWLAVAFQKRPTQFPIIKSNLN